MDYLQKLKEFITGNKQIISPVPQQQPANNFGNLLQSTVNKVGTNLNNTFNPALNAFSGNVFHAPITRMLPQQFQPYLNSRGPLTAPQLPQVPQPMANRPVTGGLIQGLRGGINMGLGLVSTPITWTGNIVKDANNNIENVVGGRSPQQYRDLNSPVSKLGYNIGSFINPDAQKAYGIKNTPQEILANVAGTAEGPLSVYGGGKVFGIGKTAAEQAGKQGFKQIVLGGLKSGASTGGVFGLLQGLSEGRNDTLKGQLLTAGKDAATGAAVGGILGGGTSALGYGVGKAAKVLKSAYHKVFPNSTDEEAALSVKQFARDEMGRFAKGQTPRADEPPYYTEYRRSLGLDPYGNPQAGFARIGDSTDEFATKIKPGETIGQFQQRMQHPDLSKYEDAFNTGDTKTLEALTKKYPNDARFNIQNSKTFSKDSTPFQIKPGEFDGVETPSSVGEILNNRSGGGNIPPPPPSSSDNFTPLPGQKERKFVTSVKEAATVTDPTKLKTQGVYTPKTNDKLMGEAKALLSAGASIEVKNVQNVDQKVTATIQHAINLDKAGQHEAAANLFNNLSKQGTELGRGVQAFSLLDKMSPEAISLSAAGKINTYNRTATRKIPELTGDQQKMISDLVSGIRDMPDGREKNIAVNELNKTINEFIPSSIADKAISVWKAGLLTSLRTHERNFLGNAIHGAAEIAKDPIATVADMGMSLKTGKRTQTTTLNGLGELVSKSTGQQMKDIVTRGYDPGVAVDKFDHKSITWGKNPVEQGLKKYTETVFNTLGASDKPFYNASFARSLYDQAGAEAINAGRSGDKAFIEGLVKKPTEDMLKVALSDANVATFKNKNIATVASTALKRALGTSELAKIAGEVTMPFTGVPSSILGQVQAYSPIGLVKGIVNAGRVTIGKMPELQRQAAQEIGRGVIGTGIFGLGAYLASKGLITGQPKDATESRQWEIENKPRNSIMIGGKWRSLNSIGPEAIVFLAGTKLQQEMKNPEGSAQNYGLTLAKDQLDQSFLTGLQAPVNAITDPGRYAQSYIGNTSSSFVPNLLKDTSKALDSTARETNTVKDYVQAAIPGLRNKLLPRRDVLGNEIPQEPTGIGAFLDVFNSKTPVNNQVVKELSRLNDVGSNSTPSKLTPSQTILKQKVKLTFDQLNNLEKGVGEALKPKLEALIASPTYQQLDDEHKANAIDNVVKDVRLKYKNTNASDILSGQSATNYPQLKLPASQILGSSTGLKSNTDATGQIYSYVDENGNYKEIDTSSPQYQQQVRDAEYSLATDRLERTGDYAGWTKVSEDYLSSLKDQANKLGQPYQAIDKIKLQNKIEDLQTKIDKYKSYGGFKKGKKPKSFSVSFKKSKPAKFTVSRKYGSSSRLTTTAKSPNAPSIKKLSYKGAPLRIKK